MNRLRLWWCLPLIFLLAACGGEAVEPAAEVSELAPRSEAVAAPTVVVPTEVVAVVPESPTAVPTATVEPTAAVDPTAEPEPEEADEVEEVAAEPAAVGVAFYGRTEEGALFRGAADAPVTLIDYSDFL